MTSENYIGLSVVTGFFIGLIFAFIAFNEPELMIFFTLIVTTVFYLIIMAGVSLFNWYMGFDAKRFHKEQLEENLEYYVSQFGKKEEELVKILDCIKYIEMAQENQQEKQTLL